MQQIIHVFPSTDEDSIVEVFSAHIHTPYPHQTVQRKIWENQLERYLSTIFSAKKTDNKTKALRIIFDKWTEDTFIQNISLDLYSKIVRMIYYQIGPNQAEYCFAYTVGTLKRLCADVQTTNIPESEASEWNAHIIFLIQNLKATISRHKSQNGDFTPFQLVLKQIKEESLKSINKYDPELGAKLLMIRGPDPKKNRFCNIQ